MSLLHFIDVKKYPRQIEMKEKWDFQSSKIRFLLSEISGFQKTILVF